jgi:hypothetical protein
VRRAGAAGARRVLAVRWREVAAGAAALAALHLVAAVYLRPIGSLWRTHIAPNQGDPLFNLYLLKWVGHEAARGFAGFWDPPFFYPEKGVLAWSDHLLGPGLAAAAWNAAVPGWVGAYNALLLSSFAWTGAAMAWVLRASGRSWRAAVLGAGLYAFCPFRWDQLPHLQVLTMAAIPLALWSFDRLLARPSWRRAAVFLPCYAVHLSGGAYLAAMIHLPLLVLAGNRWAPGWVERARGSGRTDAWRKGSWSVLAATVGAAAGLAVATFWQYAHAVGRERLAWTAAAQRHWGASLLSFLQPSASNLYGGLWPEGLFRSENCLFPGWTALALCLAGVALARRKPEPGCADSEYRRTPASWRLAALGLVGIGWAWAELLTWNETTHWLRERGPAEGGPPRSGLAAGALPGTGYELPLALVLAGGAAWVALYRRDKGRWPWHRIAALDPWPRGLLLAGIATVLLSTPLFYLPLARWLPGLSAMRVPARFHAFTMVTVAFFAAAAFDALLARLRAPEPRSGSRDAAGEAPLHASEPRSGTLDAAGEASEIGAAGPRGRRRAALFAAVLFAAALVELAPRTMSWEPLAEEEDFPPVYAWLAQQPDVHALLELPLEDPETDWLGPASLQAMYFGTRHWRPLVNGYSAHFSPAYQLLAATCCDPVPDPATLANLERSGVTHLLIHRHHLPNRQRKALDEWTDTTDAELVYAAGGDRVYRLGGAPR